MTLSTHQSSPQNQLTTKTVEIAKQGIAYVQSEDGRAQMAEFGRNQIQNSEKLVAATMKQVRRAKRLWLVTRLAIAIFIGLLVAAFSAILGLGTTALLIGTGFGFGTYVFVSLSGKFILKGLSYTLFGRTISSGLNMAQQLAPTPPPTKARLAKTTPTLRKQQKSKTQAPKAENETPSRFLSTVSIYSWRFNLLIGYIVFLGTLLPTLEVTETDMNIPPLTMVGFAVGTIGVLIIGRIIRALSNRWPIPIALIGCIICGLLLFVLRAEIFALIGGILYIIWTLVAGIFMFWMFIMAATRHDTTLNHQARGGYSVEEMLMADYDRQQAKKQR